MNSYDPPKKTGFTSISDLLGTYDKEPEKNVSREFQRYGFELAQSLGDMKHKALYIKLAKETPRGILEAAYSFVSDAPNVKSKGRLFMWKLAQLKGDKKGKKE